VWDYTDRVREHFFNPHNVGEIEDPDGIGEVGSLACGDALRLTLRIDENERIVDARFRTFGCASAIASASILTDLIIGKTVSEAEQVTNRDIADALGGLPEQKMHCSVMGREALEAALADFRGHREGGPRELEGTVICKCFGVTDVEIRRAIRENGLQSVEEITNYTKAGGGCGGCRDLIQEILDGELGREPERQPEQPKLTNVQKIRLIEEVLEREVRPALRADGGDIELVDVDGDRVVVSMRGRCANCPASGTTLDQHVGKKLRELVHPDLFVEEA